MFCFALQCPECNIENVLQLWIIFDDPFIAFQCCAVSFLENLTSDSLGLASEEFDRYMSGKAIPFTSLQAGVMVSEGLRLMYQNMSTLTELRQKQQLLQQQVQQLELEMEGFSVSTRQYLNTEFALEH